MSNRKTRKPAASPQRRPQPRLPSNQKLPWLLRAIDDAIQTAATNLSCTFYRVSLVPLSERAETWLSPQLRLVNGYVQSYAFPITTSKAAYIEPQTPRHETAISQTAMLEACTLRNLRTQAATTSEYQSSGQNLPELIELRAGYLDQPGCLAITIGFSQPFREEFLLILVSVVGDDAAENATCAQTALPAIETFCRNTYGDLSVLSL